MLIRKSLSVFDRKEVCFLSPHFNPLVSRFRYDSIIYVPSEPNASRYLFRGKKKPYSMLLFQIYIRLNRHCANGGMKIIQAFQTEYKTSMNASIQSKNNEPVSDKQRVGIFNSTERVFCFRNYDFNEEIRYNLLIIEGQCLPLSGTGSRCTCPSCTSEVDEYIGGISAKQRRFN